MFEQCNQIRSLVTVGGMTFITNDRIFGHKLHAVTQDIPKAGAPIHSGANHHDETLLEGRSRLGFKDTDGSSLAQLNQSFRQDTTSFPEGAFVPFFKSTAS